MSKKSQIRVDSLSRLMAYILGHRPDEFGLVPDGEGFVPYKELLWAIHEEPGWGYVRQGHINEVLVGKDRSIFQAGENAIRSVDRRWNLDLVPAETVPAILLIPVRRRAHPRALEKGLEPGGGTLLVLSPEKGMALRIGKRRDQKPVLLEVNAGLARTEGVPFHAFGELFLAGAIAARYITGPPLPKEALKEKEAPKEKRPVEKLGIEAGTFILDPGRDPAVHRQAKGRKGKGWKEEARGLRRRKGR